MALPAEIISLAAQVVDDLRARGETLSTAESLTAGVDPALIAEHSAISEEVAIAMAQGALKSFGTTWAIGTTGVAGPNPLDGHPVGAVWVAIAGPVCQSIELSLSGERESVRNAATASAIATFARILRHRA
jgi:nicotinamide-nucleotide amidase